MTSPQDLSRADFIGFDKTDVLLDGLNAMGLTLTQQNFPVITENHLVQWELVKHRLGIGVMQADIGDAEPMVERVPSGIEPIIVPIWLTAHREVNTSRRVRVVFDLLYEHLRRGTKAQR